MCASRIALTEDQEKVLIEGYLARGLTNKEIGEQMGCHGTTIGRKIRKFGIIKHSRENILPPEFEQNLCTNADHTSLENRKIDDSFKKLIMYKKFSKEEGIDVSMNVILSHLDKTDQLEALQKDVLSESELIDRIENLIKNIIDTESERKELPWLLD